MFSTKKKKKKKAYCLVGGSDYKEACAFVEKKFMEKINDVPNKKMYRCLLFDFRHFFPSNPPFLMS